MQYALVVSAPAIKAVYTPQLLSLTYPHTLNTFKDVHLHTLAHTQIHKNMYNKTKRLDLVPYNQLIRGLPSLAHRQLFVRTRKYSVPNLKKNKMYGPVSMMLTTVSLINVMVAKSQLTFHVSVFFGISEFTFSHPHTNTSTVKIKTEYIFSVITIQVRRSTIEYNLGLRPPRFFQTSTNYFRDCSLNFHLFCFFTLFLCFC